MLQMGHILSFCDTALQPWAMWSGKFTLYIHDHRVICPSPGHQLKKFNQMCDVFGGHLGCSLTDNFGQHRYDLWLSLSVGSVNGNKSQNLTDETTQGTQSTGTFMFTELSSKKSPDSFLTQEQQLIGVPRRYLSYLFTATRPRSNVSYSAGLEGLYMGCLSSPATVASKLTPNLTPLWWYSRPHWWLSVGFVITPCIKIQRTAIGAIDEPSRRTKAYLINHKISSVSGTFDILIAYIEVLDIELRQTFRRTDHNGTYTLSLSTLVTYGTKRLYTTGSHTNFKGFAHDSTSSTIDN